MTHQGGLAAFYDTTAGRWYKGAAFGNSTSVAVSFEGADLSSSVPFTWATGDVLTIRWGGRTDPNATALRRA